VPELPEVETIRRQLEPAIRERTIRSVRVHDERWARPASPRAVERAVSGRRIDAVERRGKYLLLRLDDGSTLMMHLRMTGNLLLRQPGEERVRDLERERFGGPRAYEGSTDLRHLRAELELDDGSRLLFTDPRRFGHAAVLGADELEPYFEARLGVEPLSGELTPEALARIAADRTAPLKSFLLTQTRIAGIGNIYADEALHRAGLHPLSPAGSLKPEDCERLVAGIVEALEAGLRLGGASMDDYLDSRGERGGMQEEFLVHTREGEPCPRCGAPILRIVVGGRSTYYCGSCQRRLRRRPKRGGRGARPAGAR
jgi:formamidopyrimidine-DNA glycosylase